MRNPESAGCVARGWKDHPRVWGCRESLVPGPTPEEWPSPEGRSLGFPLPFSFLGNNLLSLSPASCPSSPLLVGMLQFSRLHFTRTSAPLSILVRTISKFLTHFVLAVCEHWVVEKAPEGQEHRGQVLSVPFGHLCKNVI